MLVFCLEDVERAVLVTAEACYVTEERADELRLCDACFRAFGQV
jgi:hypothetical protein